MKRILILLLAASLAIVGCQKIATTPQNAEQIHKAALTFDTHCDTPYNLLEPGWNIAEEHDPSLGESGKIDLPRMKKGGLDAEFFAAYVSQRNRTPENYDWAFAKANELIAAVHKMCEDNPQLIKLATNSWDAAENEKAGLLSAYIGIENGFAVGKDKSRVEKFYNDGVRYITLCHSRNNDICDSANDPDGAEHDGLSEFGVQVVSEMNRVGMIIDVSHASDKAFYDIVGASAVPVIASHSCARALCNNPRNMTDDMLKTLAENGGVMQMCILSDYVKAPQENSPKKAELQALRDKYGPWSLIEDAAIKKQYSDEYDAVQEKYAHERATVRDVVDHIDHVVQLVGIDYIGIGTDFDGGGSVNGCNEVSEMGNITKELLKRGYSVQDVQKIWGGNFLRVFRQVEAHTRPT